VVAAPTCPVERVPPFPGCAPRPLAASLLIHRGGSGAPGTRVHSGADGRFRVRLSPGRYVVQAMAQTGSPFPRPPAPETVTVHPHRFTTVTITYDTGIR
jgi:hypothetical protein